MSFELCLIYIMGFRVFESLWKNGVVFTLKLFFLKNICSLKKNKYLCHIGMASWNWNINRFERKGLKTFSAAYCFLLFFFSHFFFNQWINKKRLNRNWYLQIRNSEMEDAIPLRLRKQHFFIDIFFICLEYLSQDTKTAKWLLSAAKRKN